MRLIDADALIDEFNWLKSIVSPCNQDEIEETIQRIKNAPTVQCKNCIYFNEGEGRTR